MRRQMRLWRRRYRVAALSSQAQTRPELRELGSGVSDILRGGGDPKSPQRRLAAGRRVALERLVVEAHECIALASTFHASDANVSAPAWFEALSLLDHHDQAAVFHHRTCATRDPTIRPLPCPPSAEDAASAQMRRRNAQVVFFFEAY